MLLFASSLLVPIASSRLSSTGLDPLAHDLGWEISPSIVELNTPIDFTIAVKQQNLKALEAKALAVSTPSDPAYGKHLTRREIEKLTAPAAEDIAAVTAHLDANGLKGAYTVTQHNVHVTTTVGVASKALFPALTEVEVEDGDAATQVDGAETVARVTGFSRVSHLKMGEKVSCHSVAAVAVEMPS